MDPSMHTDFVPTALEYGRERLWVEHGRDSGDEKRCRHFVALEQVQDTYKSYPAIVDTVGVDTGSDVRRVVDRSHLVVEGQRDRHLRAVRPRRRLERRPCFDTRPELANAFVLPHPHRLLLALRFLQRVGLASGGTGSHEQDRREDFPAGAHVNFPHITSLTASLHRCRTACRTHWPVSGTSSFVSHMTPKLKNSSPSIEICWLMR